MYIFDLPVPNSLFLSLSNFYISHFLIFFTQSVYPFTLPFLFHWIFSYINVSIFCHYLFQLIYSAFLPRNFSTFLIFSIPFPCYIYALSFLIHSVYSHYKIFILFHVMFPSISYCFVPVGLSPSQFFYPFPLNICVYFFNFSAPLTLFLSLNFYLFSSKN